MTDDKNERQDEGVMGQFLLLCVVIWLMAIGLGTILGRFLGRWIGALGFLLAWMIARLFHKDAAKGMDLGMLIGQIIGFGVSFVICINGAIRLSILAAQNMLH